MRRFPHRILPLALALAVSALVAPRLSASEADEAAIRKLHADFAAAWNRHDPAALAAFWTPDGDLFNPEGRWAKGKTQVQKNFADEQSGMFASSTFTNVIQGVRFLGPNTAIVDASFVITNVTQPNGPPMTQSGVYKAVMVKNAGKWWTASAMAMVPVSSSGGPAHAHH